MNWNDPDTRLTKNFTVEEALYLAAWRKLHTPTDHEKQNILKTLDVMEKIRAVCQHRIITVHCLIRPLEYNRLIGGAKKSAHIEGLACDFSIETMNCDDIRRLILPHLESLKIRMEDAKGSDWVHIDLNPPAPNKSRFFKP